MLRLATHAVLSCRRLRGGNVTVLQRLPSLGGQSTPLEGSNFSLGGNASGTKLASVLLREDEASVAYHLGRLMEGDWVAVYSRKHASVVLVPQHDLLRPRRYLGSISSVGQAMVFHLACLNELLVPSHRQVSVLGAREAQILTKQPHLAIRIDHRAVLKRLAHSHCIWEQMVMATSQSLGIHPIPWTIREIGSHLAVRRL